MLGAAQVDAGRPDAALRAYTRALNCDGETGLTSDVPDDTGWRVRAGMAKIHLSRNQYGDAADCLVGALVLNPTNAELHALLAHTYEAVGRSGDARRHLESAVMVSRAGPGAYLAFGYFFTKKAEEALLRGLVDNAESHLLLERIERLRAARAIA
jgi:Flp pilus assembly protein TadD